MEYLEIPYTVVPQNNADAFSVSIQNKKFIYELEKKLRSFNLPLMNRK